MNKLEQDYVKLIDKIMTFGEKNQTRNAETISIFGETLKIDCLRNGEFPLITGRKMYPKGIIGEFAAFVNTPDTVRDFTSRGCNYWHKWADEDGNLNLDYGNSWFNWNGIDQVKNVIDTLKTNPKDRRMIITGWNPDNLEDLSLPCCHMLYQFHVDNRGYVNMIWYQRSVDVMVGLPSDFVLAALLLSTIAKEAGLLPGTITMMLGDTHIYSDHMTNAVSYAEREKSTLPIYKLTSGIYDFEPENIEIFGYIHQAPIKFKLHG